MTIRTNQERELYETIYPIIVFIRRIIQNSYSCEITLRDGNYVVMCECISMIEGASRISQVSLTENNQIHGMLHLARDFLSRNGIVYIHFSYRDDGTMHGLSYLSSDDIRHMTF